MIATFNSHVVAERLFTRGDTFAEQVARMKLIV
jgi:hypothetical protein